MASFLDIVESIQDKIPTKKRTKTLEIDGQEVKVLYEVTLPIPDTHTVQGTCLRIDILSIYFRGIEVTEVIHPSYMVALENELVSHHS